MTATGFYLLTIIMFFSVWLIKLNALDINASRVRTTYVIFICIWIAYTFLLAGSGVLESFSLPPRVPLLIVIPAIAVILFVTSRPWFKDSIRNTPVYTLIYIQAFRIVVEVLIYSAYRNDIYPQRTTFEGLNFDIVVGCSALLVGYLAQKNLIGKTAIVVWNFLSLAILGLTVYSFISAYYFTDYVSATNNVEFVRMPYLLLPAVLLPYAVFFHVASIRQMFQS
jgi:hypothetical protein